MKYKLLRFTLLSALVLLCGGGIFALGHALTKAQDEAQPEVTLDFTDKDAWNIPTSGSSNKDLASFTDGTNTIKLYATTNYKMNTGYLILGKKDSYLELPAFDFDVEKIEVTGTSGASESVKQNIYVGDEAVSTETTGAKNVTNTYLINSAYQAAGNIYKLKVTSAHNTQITYIKVYKKEDSRIATTMTLTNIAKVGVVNDASSFPTKEVKGNDGTTIETYMDEVSYVIADPTVATVFEGNKIKYLATGTTTVTINWSGNSNYQPCSASYNLTVVDNPYTSFAALQAAATTTSTSVGITLNGQKVVYVNGNNAYLADSEGNGLLVYTKDHGLRAGSTLTGTFGCNLVLYQGNTEITDFELSDLDGNEFGNAEPVAMVLGDITTANQSTLITLTNVTYDAENKVFTDGTNTIAYFNKFCKTADNPEPVLEDGRTYEVTGIIVLYNETIEICPREAADVKDISTDPVGFRDIKVTLADADKWQALVANGASVYITVAEDGTISTTDNADIAAATLTGKWHSTGYGWSNFTASVPVEGCVKITYATHDYGNDIVVTNDAGEEVAKLNTTGAKWSSDPSNVVVAYYRTNAPTTLHFSKANYNPYFAVEAIDEADLPPLPTTITLTYYDTDGTTIIGTQELDGQVEIGQFQYGATDVTVADGKAFRGWFATANGGKKYQTTDVPEGDLALYAVATDIEVAEAGKTFTYNLTNQFFYFEDHELISTTGNGYWHDSTHGWAFKNGDVVTLEVAGNATITATLCQYGSGTGIAVKKNGETLGTIDGIAASDGGTAVFNYEGEAGTLTLEMQCGGEMYIHAISVNNASGETPQPHDPVTLIWDYTEQNIPTQGPDNGLYYGAYVNDAAGTNNGMHGVKLNSSGWAYFEKPAVAGKLTLTFGNRKTADAYAVNVFKGTLNAEGKGVKGDLIGEIAISESPGSGSIELDADVTGVYIERKTSSEGVLQKIVFKESVPRTFVDFEITNDQLKGEFDSSTLPEGVLFSGTQRNDDHGYGNVTIVVPVDGTVKFSIGGCQYANPANCKVTNAAGETLATPNLKTTKCYHQDGTVVTYFYVGEPTTLTFSDIAYLPYFKAEATEVSEVTITYKDQNGNVLGKKTVYEGDPIGEIPYTEADLNIGEGVKFRGWIYTSGIKVKTTDIVSANITVSALVTPIEHSPEVGTVQTYDLTKATFYPEDHENFNVEGGYYHDGQHGWAFGNGEKFEVAVGGKAQIVLTLCQYSKANATFTVKDAQNNVVADDVPGIAETDGATTIVNYDGPASMLSFTYNTEGESYLHSVKVYNVSDFVEKDETSDYYIIPAGDGAGLIMAINQASSEENSKIFLPNGTYDLGETVLTGISGKNVSIIGESMEGVIIKNAPDVSLEGLGSADLLVNTGEGLYLQDLTLQNALDFYAAGSAGRAVTLHDKGTKTINKNVRHLSYQDTYYSHKTGGLFYFEGGEIHGTVDYMCGYGRVYFNKVTLVNEQRNTATMTANSELYVFNECVVENNADVYNFGRAWSNHPTCIFLNTTLKDPDKLATTRWNLTGINCDYSIAGEYGTMNAQGENITPAANNVTFTKENTSMNTILDASALETYSIQNVLGEWAETAQDQAKQVTAPTAELKDGTISWEPVAGATAYALFKDGEFIGITTETSFVVETGDAASSRAQDTAVYTIRAANERGGFGEPTLVTVADGIQKLNVENIEGLVIYDLQGRRVNTVTSGIYIINGKKTLIK